MSAEPRRWKIDSIAVCKHDPEHSIILDIVFDVAEVRAEHWVVSDTTYDCARCVARVNHGPHLCVLWGRGEGAAAGRASACALPGYCDRVLPPAAPRCGHSVDNMCAV